MSLHPTGGKHGLGGVAPGRTGGFECEVVYDKLPEPVSIPMSLSFLSDSLED